MKIIKFLILALSICANNAFADNSIDITSDKLIIQKNPQLATFISNVKAIYRNMVLTTDKLVITYSKKDNKTVIETVRAFGNVNLTQQDDYVSSEYAEYTIGEDNIIFKENVTMKRNGNIAQGEHLIVNQKTRNAHMLSSTKNKVRAIYYKQEENNE